MFRIGSVCNMYMAQNSKDTQRCTLKRLNLFPPPWTSATQTVTVTSLFCILLEVFHIYTSV